MAATPLAYPTGRIKEMVGGGDVLCRATRSAVGFVSGAVVGGERFRQALGSDAKGGKDLPWLSRFSDRSWWARDDRVRAGDVLSNHGRQADGERRPGKPADVHRVAGRDGGRGYVSKSGR